MHYGKLSNKSIGALGERIAIRSLENGGYKFLEKNEQSRFGEVDIVMLDKATLVFVEVKTRLSNKYGWPEEAINYRKLQKLKFNSSVLFQKYKSFKRYRVDAVCIELKLNPISISRLTHYKNLTS